jgi:hypothetical protein
VSLPCPSWLPSYSESHQVEHHVIFHCLFHHILERARFVFDYHHGSLLDLQIYVVVWVTGHHCPVKQYQPMLRSLLEGKIIQNIYHGISIP